MALQICIFTVGKVEVKRTFLYPERVKNVSLFKEQIIIQKLAEKALV